VAYTIDLDFDTKLRLLSECDVGERVRLLLAAITSRTSGPRRTFPPDFSPN